MKVHNTNTRNSLLNALLQIVRLSDNQQTVECPNEADIVVTDKMDELRKLYAKYGDTKFFILLSTLQDRLDLPEDNVFGAGKSQIEAGLESLLKGLGQKFHVWTENRGKGEEKKVEKHPLGPVTTMTKSYRVLIVDDKSEHLQTAVERLVGQQILPVDSPAKALELLKLDDGREKPSIDAVLTDLNMKPDKMYQSLNLDRYGLNEEVPAGISVMFEATKRGLPVAIVTDANHHQDWFSAMFDHIKGATVNGQKVIFCQESGGKRWDAVLKKLMEGEE